MTKHGANGMARLSIPPRKPAPHRALSQRATRGIALLALVLPLLLACVALALVAPTYFAAQHTAATFCSALISRDYSSAYTTLDASARDGLEMQSWMRAARALDEASGPVTRCDASAGVGYSYTVGASTASDTVTLTRRRSAHTLTLTLSVVHGVWRITSAPDALFGVPLAPVAVAEDFCVAMRMRDYATAFGLLDPQAQGTQSSADFASTQVLRDTVSGNVSNCRLLAVSAASGEMVTALLSVTRPLAPRDGGALQIINDGSAWRIIGLDAAVLGVDVGPFQTGRQFCASVSAGDFTSAWGLLTSDLQAQTTASQLRAALTPVSGVRWGCDQPVTGSYTVSGAAASYGMPLLDANGMFIQKSVTLQFTLIEGQWLVSGY